MTLSAVGTVSRAAEASDFPEAHGTQAPHDWAHAREARLDEMGAHYTRDPEPIRRVIDAEQHAPQNDNADDQKYCAFKRHSKNTSRVRADLLIGIGRSKATPTVERGQQVTDLSPYPNLEEILSPGPPVSVRHDGLREKINRTVHYCR